RSIITLRSSFMGAPPGICLLRASASIARDELLLSPWLPAGSGFRRFLHTAFLPARASATLRGPPQRVGAAPPAPRTIQLYVLSAWPDLRMGRAWTLPAP